MKSLQLRALKICFIIIMIKASKHSMLINIRTKLLFPSHNLITNEQQYFTRRLCCLLKLLTTVANNILRATNSLSLL